MNNVTYIIIFISNKRNTQKDGCIQQGSHFSNTTWIGSKYLHIKKKKYCNEFSLIISLLLKNLLYW